MSAVRTELGIRAGGGAVQVASHIGESINFGVRIRLTRRANRLWQC